MKKQLVIYSLVGLILVCSKTQATDCVEPQDCETLGYNKKEIYCVDDMIRCPFDPSKVFCRQQQTTKVCDTIGDILYEDKSCAIDKTDLDPSHTAIGVVFDVEGRKAIALKSGTGKAWMTTSVDIPDLKNISGPSGCKNDVNGKANTQAIINYCKANGLSCPAAEYAVSYYTKGTKAGDWYLPSGGEMWLVYQNGSKINAGLILAKGTQLNTTQGRWISNEYSARDAWFTKLTSTFYGTYKTDTGGLVTPVLAF